jgi:hypothetical protein
MTAGLGMMGLDPLSLGLRAGMGAWGSGAGVWGAGMAGMGVAGAAAGGLALAGYAGNQIMAGAQQQQQLNTALRGSFNFMNPMTGQQGFSSGQMGQIGGMMRHMTHEFGPAGEVTSMSELTKLASNMGSMGMGNGVRDVQEFNRKFREMVQTAKTMATELGTSLQEAQQMMASMKGSGIFKAAVSLPSMVNRRTEAAATLKILPACFAESSSCSGCMCADKHKCADQRKHKCARFL